MSVSPLQAAGPFLPCPTCHTLHQACVESCPACAAVAQALAAVKRLEACWDNGQSAGALAAAEEAAGWLLGLAGLLEGPVPPPDDTDKDSPLPF